MRILCILLLMMTSLQAKELKVVSYNIHHGKGMDGKLDLKRIADVIRKEKPDLVALQEVDINVPRSGNIDQAKKLAELLGMHHAFGKTIDLDGGQYGNAVLSKFPIKKSTVHKLPGPGEARVVLEVLIEIDGAFISFASIHFHHKDREARMLQAMAMNGALHPRKHPLIVAGDFNAKPDSRTMKMIKESWHILPKVGLSLTIPASEPTSEIDYIMTRNLQQKGSTSKVIAEKVASDHRPVSGIIQLLKP
ncbi:MAG: endonuclease/exonuclease/phosphatase family protein [Akkermansiaceae bacterium]